MPELNSKAWDSAYKDYRKSKHYEIHKLSREQWERFVLGEGKPKKRPKPNPKTVIKPAKRQRFSSKNGPVRDVLDKDAWVKTQREYLRWRKTDDFQKWRRKQFLKQGGTCYYCDQPIFGKVRQNIDHVIPKIRRGDNRKSNLVIACADCNKNKYSDMLPYKQRQALKLKNKQKNGTYKQNLEQYSEAPIVEMLQNLE